MVKLYDIMNITCQNLYHMPYQPSTYRVLGLIRHVIQILTCNIQYIYMISNNIMYDMGVTWGVKLFYVPYVAHISLLMTFFKYPRVLALIRI
jgi:hypothetical protein